MRELELGLGAPPDRRYLFVGQDEQDTNSCWYALNHDTKTKIPVPDRALTGYITGLRCREVKTRFGPKWKLDILMDAGTPFGIRSGLDTTFTRGVVLSLIAIEDEEKLRDALVIVVTPSTDNQKIVFGSVYLARTGQRVKYVWDKDAELVPLIQNLQSVLGDGGEVDMPDDSEAEAAGAGGREHSGQGRPAGLANADQIKELKRVGASVGFVTDDTPPVLDLSLLNAECGSKFQNGDGSGKTIEQLTSNEAIEFRRLLMSM